MVWYGKHPSLSVVNDSNNPVWHWFLCNGPHGEQFKWHKSSVAPRDIDSLREFIAEITEEDSDFPSKARDVALKALENDDAIVIRTGIQVLAILGTDDDLIIIKNFLTHSDENVVKDARCCLFERGFKQASKR
jgi:hypothetical protein